MFKTISKYTWFSFVPFLTLSFVTIVLLFTGTVEVKYLAVTFAMWCLVSGLGVAVGYHRVFSHKTHSLPTWKENILLFFGTLSGQGSSITWTAIHRGYHHPFSDTPRDMHSPVFKGKWFAFFSWANQITEEANLVSMKYSVDLLRKPNHVWFHHNQLRILWAVPALAALFDWKLSLVGFVLPVGLALVQDNLVNVFGHVKGLIGYRNYDTKDQSQNNFVLGYLGWGQGWHNSHHAHPETYLYGDKWWEWDPCVLWLWFLGAPREGQLRYVKHDDERVHSKSS